MTKSGKIKHHFPLLILHSPPSLYRQKMWKATFRCSFYQTYCVSSTREHSNQFIFFFPLPDAEHRSVRAGISCSLCRVRMRNGDPRQQEAVLWSIWSFGLSLLLSEIRPLRQNSNNNMERRAHKSIDGGWKIKSNSERTDCGRDKPAASCSQEVENPPQTL